LDPLGPHSQRQDHLEGRSSTIPEVAQLAQLTPSPPIIEYYSSLHHCNRLLRIYTVILILAGFMMAMATNPDLFPTASDPASHDRFESFKDEIQELIQQQNYISKGGLKLALFLRPEVVNVPGGSIRNTLEPIWWQHSNRGKFFQAQ
jgi:hypothetical protein